MLDHFIKTVGDEGIKTSIKFARLYLALSLAALSIIATSLILIAAVPVFTTIPALFWITFSLATFLSTLLLAAFIAKMVVLNYAANEIDDSKAKHSENPDEDKEHDDEESKDLAVHKASVSSGKRSRSSASGSRNYNDSADDSVSEDDHPDGYSSYYDSNGEDSFKPNTRQKRLILVN